MSPLQPDSGAVNVKAGKDYSFLSLMPTVSPVATTISSVNSELNPMQCKGDQSYQSIKQ